MIESTLIERQAYALAALRELEESSGTKNIPWLAIDDLRTRISTGLQCTINHVDELVTAFIGTKLEVHESGRAVRFMRGAA